LFTRLAGQHAQYTERQLKALNQRERTKVNAVMYAVAVNLTELKLKAVASSISSLKQPRIQRAGSSGRKQGPPGPSHVAKIQRGRMRWRCFRRRCRWVGATSHGRERSAQQSQMGA
jgi:hypothetical protein